MKKTGRTAPGPALLKTWSWKVIQVDHSEGFHEKSGHFSPDQLLPMMVQD